MSTTEWDKWDSWDRVRCNNCLRVPVMHHAAPQSRNHSYKPTLPTFNAPLRYVECDFAPKSFPSIPALIPLTTSPITATSTAKLSPLSIFIASTFPTLVEDRRVVYVLSMIVTKSGIGDKGPQEISTSPSGAGVDVSVMRYRSCGIRWIVRA